jgi:hypothetical protein
LESKKLENKKDKVMINRQRNTIIKIKKDYGFNYLLFYKTVNKDSEKKKYIRTFKYLIYIYKLYLNPFSFKIYEKNIIKY